MPTYPGFHPDFQLSSYPKELEESIRKIARSFYVTRAFKAIEVGNSVYWGMLVRPTEEFSVYINTDREVLVLFSLYESFEIRTLEAYDHFYDLTESKRIDKSLRFLMSRDDRIEASIRHYLSQNPEYPIIIPLTFKQHMQAEGNPLLDAVRRNYLLRDLFGYQNPLREETFFLEGKRSLTQSWIWQSPVKVQACLD